MVTVAFISLSPTKALNPPPLLGDLPSPLPGAAAAAGPAPAPACAHEQLGALGQGRGSGSPGWQLHAGPRVGKPVRPQLGAPG